MNKKKKIVLALSVLILFTIANAISLYQHQIKVQAKEAQEEATEVLSTTKKDIDFLYLDEQKELLSDSVTREDFKKAEDSFQLLSTLTLNKIQQAELTIFSKEIDEAKQMFAIKTALHKKYKDGKITSDQVEFSKEEKELNLLKK